MLKITLESKDGKYKFDATLTDNCKRILNSNGNEASKLCNGALDYSSWSLVFPQKSGMSVEFHFRKNERGENSLIPWMGLAYEEGREVNFGFTTYNRYLDKVETEVKVHRPQKVDAVNSNRIEDLRK